jgi:hypothetical protein
MRKVDLLEYEEMQKTGEWKTGCLFPGKCLMPGDHFPYECHTAQMMRDWVEEQKAESPLYCKLHGFWWMCLGYWSNYVLMPIEKARNWYKSYCPDCGQLTIRFGRKVGNHRQCSPF